MPRSRTSSTARGYGRAYRAARSELLKDNPACYWCGAPATTADHDPPISVAGEHLNLVPACAPCNYGRQAKTMPKRAVVNPSREW